MKSIENKLNEALKALDKAGKRKQFDEASKSLTAIETKLNCAEEILGTKISDTFNGKESDIAKAVKSLSDAQYQVFAEARRKNPSMTVQEQCEFACSLRRVQKHNGAGDNFNESDPFNEGRSNTTTITEADPVTKKKLELVESLKTTGVDEGLARGIAGLEPKVPEGLTRLQEAEYTFAVRCGIKPDDALKLAKLAAPIRPHARF